MGDARRAFDLYTEQKLALWVERPRLAAGEILLLINAPDRGRRRLRPAAARPVADLVGACFVMREAPGSDEPLHPGGRLSLLDQDAIDAARQELAELPGVRSYARPRHAVYRPP